MTGIEKYPTIRDVRKFIDSFNNSYVVRVTNRRVGGQVTDTEIYFKATKAVCKTIGRELNCPIWIGGNNYYYVSIDYVPVSSKN